eukprot:s4272_g3.t1
MRAHHEAPQSLDLRKDLARRVMPSDGPYQKGDRVFVWDMRESKKKKSERAWARGIVVSQEGAMVLVEVHRAVLRVNQSKVRRDGDPWHDVAIPLKSDDSRGSEQSEERHMKTEREAHLTMRHSNVLAIRFLIVLSQVIVTNMRSVVILSLQERAISLRSRLISRDSRLAPFILVLRRVNLLSLANGLPRRFNLLLHLGGR